MLKHAILCAGFVLIGVTDAQAQSLYYGTDTETTKEVLESNKSTMTDNERGFWAFLFDWGDHDKEKSSNNTKVQKAEKPDYQHEANNQAYKELHD